MSHKITEKEIKDAYQISGEVDMDIITDDDFHTFAIGSIQRSRGRSLVLLNDYSHEDDVDNQVIIRDENEALSVVNLIMESFFPFLPHRLNATFFPPVRMDA